MVGVFELNGGLGLFLMECRSPVTACRGGCQVKYFGLPCKIVAVLLGTVITVLLKQQRHHCYAGRLVSAADGLDQTIGVMLGAGLGQLSLFKLRLMQQLFYYLSASDHDDFSGRWPSVRQ